VEDSGMEIWKNSLFYEHAEQRAEVTNLGVLDELGNDNGIIL
jgi:hypothetical protein